MFLGLRRSRSEVVHDKPSSRSLSVSLSPSLIHHLAQPRLSQFLWKYGRHRTPVSPQQGRKPCIGEHEGGPPVEPSQNYTSVLHIAHGLVGLCVLIIAVAPIVRCLFRAAPPGLDSDLALDIACSTWSS